MLKVYKHSVVKLIAIKITFLFYQEALEALSLAQLPWVHESHGTLPSALAEKLSSPLSASGTGSAPE